MYVSLDLDRAEITPFEINLVTADGKCRFSVIITKEIGNSVLCQNRNRRLLIPRHKSNGFIAHQKLSSSSAAAASYEAEDHVEDSRVRNANCNYGRACAHDILHLWSPSFSYSFRYSLLALLFSFSLSFFLLLSDSNSTRKLQRHVWTCIYNARLHTYTLRHLRMRTRRMIISLTVERWRYLKLVTQFWFFWSDFVFKIPLHVKSFEKNRTVIVYIIIEKQNI